MDVLLRGAAGSDAMAAFGRSVLAAFAGAGGENWGEGVLQFRGMTVEFSEGVERRLRSRAAARGVAPERYVEEVLERDLAGEAPDAASDAIAEKKAKLARMAERSREFWSGREHPPIPEGAFSSEALYEESE